MSGEDDFRIRPGRIRSTRAQQARPFIAQALAALCRPRRWHQQGDGDPGDTGGLLLLSAGATRRGNACITLIRCLTGGERERTKAREQ